LINQGPSPEKFSGVQANKPERLKAQGVKKPENKGISKIEAIWDRPVSGRTGERRIPYAACFYHLHAHPA
jgi:hypothetical protein